MDRRKVIKNLALGSLILPSGIASLASENNTSGLDDKGLKRAINHSVCRWTFEQLSIEELCILVKKMRI